MSNNLLFSIIEQVDSTNNYAMNLVHNGSVKHGMAIFTNHQTAGKGQRGKIWESKSGVNILQSLIIQPPQVFHSKPFLFNALIATNVASFLENIVKEPVQLKWPNDLYIRDRKAGGILIENNYRGNHWNWSIIGMGINVNQLFDNTLERKPISLQEITGKTYPIIDLAKDLHAKIIDNLNNVSLEEILTTYNKRLYKFKQAVVLKYQNENIHTTINGVDENGQLLTTDKVFNFGEVEWLLDANSTK